MARFELDENYIVGQHPEGYEEAAQFCVVEADNNGRIRMRGYDLISDTFFCDYFIENINDSDTFAYTYKNLKAHDRAPVFPEKAQAVAAFTENGDYRISFTEADVPDGFIVHEYKAEIKNQNSKTVYKDNFIAAYYIIDNDNIQDFNVSKDVLTPGETYSVTLTAESAYHLYSDPVELTFTIPQK